MNGRRILVIEDDPDIQRFITTVLKLEGAQVVVATRGNEGLSLIAADDPFDLIILDLALPDITGWDVLDSLKPAFRQKGHCPVVIFSASADMQKREKALKMGAAGYIVKPVGARELVKRLTEHIGAPVRD